MESLFFTDFDKTTKSFLTDIACDYFIDTSGSTCGNILEAEKISALNISNVLKQKFIFGWSNQATQVKAFHELGSSGNTEPCCFSEFICKSKCAIVYTDGEISLESMEKFTNCLVGKMDNIPIIVVFAIKHFDIDIKTMEQTINMSVPEALLTTSNDVLILITATNKHKILMTKGCFNDLPALGLEPSTMISSLPDFVPNDHLKTVMVASGLPDYVVKLRDIDGYINLNALYELDEFSTEILKGLCNRAILPKLNLGVIFNKLINMNKLLNDTPEINALRNELLKVSTSPDAGTDKHKELIVMFNGMKKQSQSHEIIAKRNALNELFVLISEYQRDKTSIAFGSNRAMRSDVFADKDLEDVGICERITCPIMLDNDDACILIKRPDDPDYITKFTSDYVMESPFEFGSWLASLVSPTSCLIGFSIADKICENPFTREPIIGAIPLSINPVVIMKHMSNLFGGRKELWHFVRGFISMMVHVCDNAWMNKKHMAKYLLLLCNNYNATIDLKGDTERVQILVAFKNVLTNYSTCLRDRSCNDILAIVKIVKFLAPEFAFDEEAVVGMAKVVGTFIQLLNKHKKDEDMTKYVMEVDDFGHYVKCKTGLSALIAQIFWYDTDGTYRSMKSQIALDNALCDEKFGSSLKLAFAGKPFDESILECAYDEPLGDHFGSELPDVWTPEGLPELTCIYCGQQFETTLEKFIHLKEKFGKYFFNGHLAVKHTIAEIGKQATEKELFVLAKKKLLNRYGQRNKSMHTQRTKQRLLYFIRKFKE